ncbi:hypothetical protein ScPMuIL_006886 [Solemya velum]
MLNVTDGNFSGNWTGRFIHPFSDLHVRVIFIIFYSVVFALCVFGNSMVLFAIIRSARLRSMTNFFLANLAVADFCVGVFCVLPNLSIFLSAKWILGRVMCKIYYFVWHMSYTASISILTVIAMERYVAIIHPLKARTLITPLKLKIAQAIIWLIAAGYNVPYLIIFDTVYIGDFVYCFPKLHTLDMKAMSAAELVVWYTVPLSLMIFMYTRISVTLWRTTKNETFRMKKMTGNTKQRQSIGSSEKQCFNGEKKNRYKSKEKQNRGIKPNNEILVEIPLTLESDKGSDDKQYSCDDVSKSSGSDNLNQTDIEEVPIKCKNSDDSRCRVSFNYHATSNNSKRTYGSEKPTIHKIQIYVCLGNIDNCVLPAVNSSSDFSYATDGISSSADHTSCDDPCSVESLNCIIIFMDLCL